MSDQATVFVVDDDPHVCDGVATLFKSMGLAAEQFGSAEEFLAAYDPARPGCLVTDLRMQGKSGLDLQEELLSRNVQLPVIFMTAYADVPTTVKIMKNGATSVFEKPFREQDLWNAVRQAIDQDAENRLRIDHVEDVRRRLDGLSEKRRQVLDLLVAGEMNKTIAKKLGVSLRTVEQHRHDLLLEMKVDSLAALIRLSIEAEVPVSR